MEKSPNPSSNESSAPDQWESLSDFAGEKGINDKTGKKRTFTEFDIYPKQPGETNEQYGARLRFMHQKTAEYLSQQQEKEQQAEQEENKPQFEKDYDRLMEKIDQAVGRGIITESHAEKMREEAAKKRAEAQQDYTDRQSVGTPEEQSAYEDWLKSHDAENTKNLKNRGQIPGEEKDKTENEAREKLEEEEERRLKKEYEELEKRKRELQEERAKIDKELGPLAAINADFTHDKKELAHDIAEQQLNEEQEKANLIKRIWKGSLFRKYYQKKYERELLSGKREVEVNDDGERITLDNVIKDRSGSAIQRFVLGATEDMRYIHEKIGKKRKDGTYDGEKLTEADAETTAAVRGAIEKFASAKISEGGSMEDLEREFRNDIGRIKAEAKDEGRKIDAATIDNYFEVAMQARQRIEHGMAMDRVMEGFRVFNADVRNNMRTEAHRDNIDKIVNKVESSKFGSVIPAEILAMAVGSTWSLIQNGARSAARIVVPVGGIAVSGALAGLRERNRVTEDRARMMRDAAVGLEYDGTSGEEIEGHRAKKRAKYEAKIGGTLYDLRSAKELTSNITQAMESGEGEAKLRAIAEARVRISYSDSEQKDLISYSSADGMGDERMKLDIAVIRAENSLSEEDKKRLETMKAAIRKEIEGDVDKNDKNFRKVRAAQAAKQAGKTVLIGSAVFFASQEIMATLDPNKVGLFEKAGLIKTQNNEDAQETILAGLAGPRVRTETHIDTIENISGDRQTEIQQYEDAGYTKTETAHAWTETKKNLVNVDPSKSTARVKVAYDGWADNGTSVSDGNELRMYLNNGQISSGMYGTSTMGGQVIDYNSAASAGNIRMYLTIGNSKFEIASKVNAAGQLAWGDNGVFTTTTGETIRAIGDNGEKLYKYAEIVLHNGVDANGVDHIIPLATDIGADSFKGTIQQVADNVVEHPAVYNFVKTTVTEIPREVSYGGVFAAPTSRVGLGGPRSSSTGSENPSGDQTALGQTTTAQPASSETTPENSPPETQPNPNEETTTDEFVERIRRDFGNIVNDAMMDFMTSEAELDRNFPMESLSEAWDKLSDDAKLAVADFELSQENISEPHGYGLRQFLRMNPERIPNRTPAA